MLIYIIGSYTRYAYNKIITKRETNIIRKEILEIPFLPINSMRINTKVWMKKKAIFVIKIGWKNAIILKINAQILRYRRTYIAQILRICIWQKAQLLLSYYWWYYEWIEKNKDIFEYESSRCG